MQEYADPVIDWLDAGRGILDHRLFRDVRPESRFMYANAHTYAVMYTVTEWVLLQGSVRCRARSHASLPHRQFSDKL